jgi:hypothetical protein
MRFVMLSLLVLGCAGGYDFGTDTEARRHRRDMGPPPHDLAAAPPDMSSPPDMSMLPDMSKPPAPPDMSMSPPDMSMPPADMSMPPTPPGGTCQPMVVGRDTSAAPSMPRPALSVPYTDPNYHLTVARVTDKSQVTDRDFPTWVRHEYSRRPAFNADSTRVLEISSTGWGRLYSLNSDGTLGFLTTIDPGEPSEPNWHPTDPAKIYYLDNYGKGLRIKLYDVNTKQTTTYRDLSARVTALFPNATGMWTRQEGRPSDDGRIWCLEAGHTTTSGDFVDDGFFSYDIVADQIKGSMPVTSSPDHISTSPRGNYCVPSWGLPTGTRAYTLDFSTYVQLHDRSEHSDLRVSKAGDEVIVYTAYDGQDAGNVMMVRLSDGARTPLFPLYGPNSSAISMHISGTNKLKPGYVAVSLYNCHQPTGTCDPTVQWFDDKVIIVSLEANPKIYNLAHIHYGNAGYWSEPQAVASPDLKRILVTSTWGSTLEGDVADYMIQVPVCGLP